jgi:hypothetical protein
LKVCELVGRWVASLVNETVVRLVVLKAVLSDIVVVEKKVAGKELDLEEWRVFAKAASKEPLLAELSAD